MGATKIVTENLDASWPRSRVEAEIQLRIQAGAVRAWIDDDGPKWTLKSEWTIID